MRRGLKAALIRWRVTIRYYLQASPARQLQLRREVGQIESELRTTLSEVEVDAMLGCATYTEMAVKQLEESYPGRTSHFNKQARIASEAAKRIYVERSTQSRREERWKK